MNNIYDGGPAFPVVETEYNPDVEKRELTTVSNGMFLRDYFAAHAPDVPEDFDWISAEVHTVERSTRWAYFYADEMLKARERQS